MSSQLLHVVCLKCKNVLTSFGTTLEIILKACIWCERQTDIHRCMCCAAVIQHIPQPELNLLTGGRKTESLFGDAVLADKDAALQTCMEQEGRLGFLAELQCQEKTEGDNERWEENKQHGATCCVKTEPGDYERNGCICRGVMWRGGCRHVPAGMLKVVLLKEEKVCSNNLVYSLNKSVLMKVFSLHNISNLQQLNIWYNSTKKTHLGYATLELTCLIHSVVVQIHQIHVIAVF